MTRIAVTYENGQVFQHFGRTQQFKIFEVEDGRVLNERILDANEEGHAALASQLRDEAVNLVICGGLGMGMLNALQGFGIEVCANVSGDVDHAVKDFLAGTLEYNTEAHECHGHHHG